MEPIIRPLVAKEGATPTHGMKQKARGCGSGLKQSSQSQGSDRITSLYFCFCLSMYYWRYEYCISSNGGYDI